MLHSVILRIENVKKVVHQIDSSRKRGINMNKSVVAWLCMFSLTLSVKTEDLLASGPISWRQDLAVASEESAASGKPILMQITATWCGACQQMFRDTYSDAQLTRFIHERFIPLKIDADEHPGAISNRSVKCFPTTLVLSATQVELGRVEGFVSAPDLASRMQPLVARQSSKFTTQVPKQEVSWAMPVVIRHPVIIPSKNDVRPSVQGQVQLVSDVKHAAPVQVGFAGICLVSTLEERKPVVGQSSYTYTYRGVRLQFASNQSLAKFQARPEKYWPWMEGDCPVSVLEKNAQINGSMMAGNPKVGGVFRDRLIFFRDEARRTAFARDPDAFIPTARALN